jgi:hypothetical protein
LYSGWYSALFTPSQAHGLPSTGTPKTLQVFKLEYLHKQDHLANEEDYSIEKAAETTILTKYASGQPFSVK